MAREQKGATKGQLKRRAERAAKVRAQVQEALGVEATDEKSVERYFEARDLIDQVLSETSRKP